MRRKIKLSAFTVIELLIAISIIGLLVAGITFGFTQVKVKAKCSRIRQDFDAIAKAASTHREVTGTWAADANTGVAPAFVPEYLTQWPSGEFYRNNELYLDGKTYDAKYDWENWNDTANNNPGQILAISLRSASTNFNEDYYYCVQDGQVNPDGCYYDIKQTPPPVNNGGTCP